MNVMLDAITNPDPIREDQLFRVEKEILETDRPNVWNVHMAGNMERKLEVEFRKFALAVTKMLNKELNRMTTFTFYAGVELLKEQNK